MVESSAHSNVDPVSLEVNAKLAEVAVTVPDGPDEIVVCGGVVSFASITEPRPVRTRLAAGQHEVG